MSFNRKSKRQRNLNRERGSVVRVTNHCSDGKTYSIFQTPRYVKRKFVLKALSIFILLSLWAVFTVDGLR